MQLMQGGVDTTPLHFSLNGPGVGEKDDFRGVVDGWR